MHPVNCGSMMRSSSLTSLPCDSLIQHIASFLPPKDALGLSLACKSTCSSLSLSSLAPRVLAGPVFWASSHASDENLCRCIRVPILACKAGKVHSVRLELDLAVQGYDDQNGRIWLVGGRCKHPNQAFPRPAPSTEGHYSQNDLPFQVQHIVHTEPAMNNTRSRIDITCSPLPDEEVQLWFQPAAGGGGQILTLLECKVTELVLGDQGGRFAAMYKNVLSRGFLTTRFGSVWFAQDCYWKLLQETCQSLRVQLIQQELAKIPERRRVLSSHEAKIVSKELGISITVPSLQAMEDILGSRIEAIGGYHCYCDEDMMNTDESISEEDEPIYFIPCGHNQEVYLCGTINGLESDEELSEARDDCDLHVPHF